MPKLEKGDNSVKYLPNFAKINQVIYALDSICEPNMMIIAQSSFPEILFTRFHRFLCNDKSDGKEKICVRLFFMLVPYIKFQDPISNHSWPHAKRYGQRYTDRPKPICPLNVFKVVGITTTFPKAVHVLHSLTGKRTKCLRNEVV